MTTIVNAKEFEGELQTNASLARYTSWRVGGLADVLFKPSNLEKLSRYLQQIPVDEPVLYLGLGSNLLVRDGGVRGHVILLHGFQPEMSVLEGQRVYASAGVPCAKVARFAANNDLVGATFLAGIPGTIGGALAMNAGAFGGETWPRVESVETMTRKGELKTRPRDEFEYGYRHLAGLEDELFVSATFQFDSGDGEAVKAEIKDLLARRSASQPTGIPSCGSVFRNPEGDYAARLIQDAGLKGSKIGGAEVSEKHANFILNRGEASASDIEAMIEHVQNTVQQTFGISLHREVRIVGEAV